MLAHDGGYAIDTLVILIFVYLSGAVTGIMGSALWLRLTKGREDAEEEEVPPPPPAIPSSGTSRSTVPPLCVMVGTTTECYAYHRTDSVDNRCSSMDDLQKKYPEQQVVKRLTPCKECFPKASDPTRGIRSRRARDNVPLVVG